MTDSYIAIDLETTGLNPRTDKIIEIGAIRIRDGKEEACFSSLVHPRRLLKEQTVEITGITDEMLTGAPDIDEVIEQILEFCTDLPLVGHHIIFDYSFLKKEAVNHGKLFENSGIDTLKLCRKFMPEAEKKNLEAACRYFEIDQAEKHRALADARAAGALFEIMEMKFGEANPLDFLPQTLIYKVKREQNASKRQKEHLRELLKYHRIDSTVQIDYLSRNEISRMTDKIIAQYGRITG